MSAPFSSELSLDHVVMDLSFLLMDNGQDGYCHPGVEFLNRNRKIRCVDRGVIFIKPSQFHQISCWLCPISIMGSVLNSSLPLMNGQTCRKTLCLPRISFNLCRDDYVKISVTSFDLQSNSAIYLTLRTNNEQEILNVIILINFTHVHSGNFIIVAL